MTQTILEKILKNVLSSYLQLNDVEVEDYLKYADLAIKERIENIDDLQIIIYSNDHTPPHFHVKTKNGKIDARFTIENCEHMDGHISSQDLKKIKAFALSVKGQTVLNTIWSKYRPNKK